MTVPMRRIVIFMKSKFVELFYLPKLNTGESVKKYIGGSNGDEL